MLSKILVGVITFSLRVGDGLSTAGIFKYTVVKDTLFGQHVLRMSKPV